MLPRKEGLVGLGCRYRKAPVESGQQSHRAEVGGGRSCHASSLWDTTPPVTVPRGHGEVRGTLRQLSQAAGDPLSQGG